MKEQADRNWDLIGYTIAPDTPPEVLAECRHVLRRNLAPCDERVALAEMARMRVSTKARSEPGEETLLGAQIFREMLMRYPEDAVVEACRWIGESQVFWPSLSELKAALDERTKKRQLLLAAVEAVPAGTTR